MIDYATTFGLRDAQQRAAQQGGSASTASTSLANTYIDPNAAFRGDQGASDLLGKLNRAQWEDWKARFQPRISQLAAMASDPGFAGEQAGNAADAVTRSYGTSQQVLETQRQRLGLHQSADQRASDARKFSLSAAADSSAAYNKAKVSARDLQDQILAGNMSVDNVPQMN